MDKLGLRRLFYNLVLGLDIFTQIKIVAWLGAYTGYGVYIDI
jgi:hypothetical protein